MTTEHENGDRDDLVSETYRELPAERAPEHLNQSILKMASEDTKRSGASRFFYSGWMKPVAWAATIGLSLAIVLELTQMPMTDLPTNTIPRSQTPSATAPSVKSVSEDNLVEDKRVVEQAQERAYQQTDALLQESREDEFRQSVDAPAVENKAMRRPAAAAVEPSQAAGQVPASTLEEIVAEDADRPAAEAKREIAVETNPEPFVDQAAARKRSADQAIADTGVAREKVAAEGIAAFAASAAIGEADAGPACDPDTRRLADDWLACIEDLRASGADELADREYEAYVLEYPERSDTN